LLVDGIVHGIGLSLALIGIVALVLSSWPLTNAKTTSLLVYAVGLVTMLSFSAAYNLWPVSPTKWILRRCDQCAIFIFIAATYTPLIAHLKPDDRTTYVLAGVWSVALFGALLKVLRPGHLDRFSIGLCVALGCSGILLYRPALDALPTSALCLIAVGGALYITGIIFHLNEKLRFQNSIWHTFVLAAAICHYAAIASCESGVR
jgi:hemolysin III